MYMGQTAWQITWAVYAIVVNLMHFTLLAATIWVCEPVSMSPPAETRLNMLFNDILKAYKAKENVGHAPCAWAKLPGS